MSRCRGRLAHRRTLRRFRGVIPEIARNRRSMSDLALLTGQSLLIFIQLVLSLRISARIFVSRFASRSSRERV